jgi:nucleotide-binding universal stress UspA family protein
VYDRILFPTDGSDGASTVFDHVLDLAAEQSATLHILNVADTTQDSVTVVGGEVIDALEEEGQKIVDAAEKRATQQSIPTVTDVIQGAVPETITTYAQQSNVDLIVMPSTGRTGLERLFLGSVTERVIRQSRIPVLTVRPDADALQYPYENVLVPTDGSDCATAALEAGVDIVRSSAESLHILSVIDVTSLGVDVHSDLQIDRLEEQASAIVNEAAEIATEAEVESVVPATQSGSSVHRVIGSYVADHDIDLVVIGTHGRTGVERYLLGSVSEQTVRNTPVPVMTIPQPD